MAQDALNLVNRRKALEPSQMRDSIAKGPGSKTQVFTKKPGPTATAKAVNSLFSQEAVHRAKTFEAPPATVPAIITSSRKGDPSKRKRPQIVEDDEEERQSLLEDFIIGAGVDYQRWNEPGYWMRTEEMSNIMACFNQLSCFFYESQGGLIKPIMPAVFLPPIHAHEGSVHLPDLLHLANAIPDWSVLDNKELSTFPEGPLRTMAFSRYPEAQQPIASRLICPMLCHKTHWVLVELFPDDRSRRPVVWEPMSVHHRSNVVDRFVWQLYQSISFWTTRTEDRPPCAPDEPMPEGYRYQQRCMSVQERGDGSSCGFWTALAALVVGLCDLQPQTTVNARHSIAEHRFAAYLPEDLVAARLVLVELLRQFHDTSISRHDTRGFIRSTALVDALSCIPNDSARSEALRAWDVNIRSALGMIDSTATFFINPVDWDWPVTWFSPAGEGTRAMRTQIVLAQALTPAAQATTHNVMHINGIGVTWRSLCRLGPLRSAQAKEDIWYNDEIVEGLMEVEYNGLRRPPAGIYAGVFSPPFVHYAGTDRDKTRDVELEGEETQFSIGIADRLSFAGRWSIFRDRNMLENEWIVHIACENRTHFIVLAARKSTRTLYIFDGLHGSYSKFGRWFLEWLDRQMVARANLIRAGANKFETDSFVAPEDLFSNYTIAETPEDYVHQPDITSCGPIAVACAAICLETQPGDPVQYQAISSAPAELEALRWRQAHALISGRTSEDDWSTLNPTRPGVRIEWDHSFPWPGRFAQDMYFLKSRTAPLRHNREVVEISSDVEEAQIDKRKGGKNTQEQSLRRSPRYAIGLTAREVDLLISSTGRPQKRQPTGSRQLRL
jgi:hypothetical protein